MKKFILLILFIISLFFVGCGEKINSSYILDEFINSFELPLTAETDLELKNSYVYSGQTISVSWESSDENIINNKGVITKTNEDSIVTITGTFVLNEATLSKEFEIIVCGKTDEECANEIFETINIPSSTSSDITLPTNVKYNDSNYRITWESSDESIISNKGFISYSAEDKSVSLTATISYNKTKYSNSYNLTVLKYDCSKINQFLNDITFESEITSDVTLPTHTKIDGKNATISWLSSAPDILNSNGKLGITLNDTNVKLTATFNLDNIHISKDYELLIKQSYNDVILDIINDQINISPIISNDIYLPTQFGAGITGVWKSSNSNIISNEGKIISYPSSPTSNTFTLTITLGENTMTKEFNASILSQPHFIMVDTFNGTLENLKLNNEGALELVDGATEGKYTSEEISCRDFYELVPTWCATTSKNATCELLISVKVDGQYSGYITYGKWGQGLKNSLKNQNIPLVKLVEDEMKILNSKTAQAIKFVVVFRRDDATYESPCLSLVTFALNLKNYTYDFDSSLLEKTVKYEVPKLYQHDVPTIGNIICSATSSTMLLNYKGYDFSNISPLQHQYIAEVVFDSGNGIYGNWVYNCVGMSSFGERAYVKRFYNVNEFLYSVQQAGPMAASIKGTVKYVNMTTGAQGSYNTAGHLLVVTGFEITDNGTYIYINDPNVKGVAIKTTLEDFLSIWRNVSYILE